MERPSALDGHTRLPAAVLWDMDGTLVDSEKLWDIALHDLAAHLGGTLSSAARKAMIGANMSATLVLLFADLGLPAEPDALARAGDSVSYTHERALRAVRAAGLPTALVTSTERALTEIALDRIGREFFDVTVCGDEVDGRNKPHPEPYLRAARLLGVRPDDCVAVEDSPTGTQAAVAAGATVLVVPCEVDVPPGERRVIRESLVGLDVAELGRLLTAEAA